jgi:hypothetical protein
MRIRLSASILTTIASTTAGALIRGTAAFGSASADAASAVRGSLGVTLEDLALSNAFGEIWFLMNGAFAFVFGAVVWQLVTRRRRGLSAKRRWRARRLRGPPRTVF